VTEAPRLILDADGVFLDEAPFWRAALLAALRRGAPQTERDERAFVAAALAEGLQRSTKQRGCNSNWDLAVVLVALLQQGAARAALAAGQWPRACAELAAAVAALPRIDALDPLARFGLDRTSPAAVATAATCDAALAEIVARDGWQCLGDPLAMRATLDALRADGCRLGICTGRSREELFPALQATGLLAAFADDAIVDVDRVAAAAATAGPECQPKPSPFPLLAAALGVDAAVALLRGERRPLPRRVVYVGDGRADVETAIAARRAGLPVQYAQIVSPATDGDTIAIARRQSWCLGVFASLAEFAAQLPAVAR
jgi:phosphoglycolate phosphatase-like HAD superfamily hydrolase